MPSLVMRAPTGSLLDHTNRLIVRRQISYATRLGLPWGMSESAFNARDLEMTYQYSNFGVPDLALKRGLGDNQVIAPYATALAAMVDPAAAVRNFTWLEAAEGLGRYGFYEALDYTPTRVPEGRDVAVVHAYMAHHQGMSILAILNTVHDGIMRTRFHAEPQIRATELLLQERTPRDVAAAHENLDLAHGGAETAERDIPMVRRIASPHTAAPATQLLSNDRYSVMVTAAGSGYSRWNDRAITRWREDMTRDDWGSFIFLRDVADDTVWSAGLQPSGTEPDSYEAEFAEERVEIARRDGTLYTTLEIVVSAEEDAEVRRVTLFNAGDEPREIELTLVHGDRARQSRGRCGASGILEDVRADRVHRRARHRHCDAPASRGDRDGSLGRAPRRRRGRNHRRRARGNRSRRLPRPRAGAAAAGGDAGRPAADWHRGHRARSHHEPAPARARRPRRQCPPRLLDDGGGRPRRRARPRRPPPHQRRVRPRLHARLDAGAGAAASSRHHPRRGGTVPAPRRPSAVRRPGASPAFRHARPRRRGAGAAVGARHFRRPADPPRAHRRSRGYRHRPPVAARARVLAHQASGLRLGDPQRKAAVVCARPAIRAGRGRADGPDAARARRRRVAGKSVRAARRAGAAGNACAAAKRRPRGVARPARHARGTARSVGRPKADPVAPAASRRRPRAASRGVRPGARILQRFRRVRRRRARIRHAAARRPDHAGAVDQYHRQPRLRLPGHRRRRRLLVVAQQPREPVDPVEQRPGGRPPRRHVLPARRGHRRAVEPDGAADPPRRRPLRGAARPGLQPIFLCAERGGICRCCNSCRSTMR